MSRRFRRIAVLMGGPSIERDVSNRSGRAVARGLRDAGYDVVEVDVKRRRLDLPAGVDAVFVALHGEFGEDGVVQAMLEKMRVPYTGSNSRASRSSFDKVLSKRLMTKHNVSTPAYEVLRRGRKRTLPLPVVVKPARQGSSIGVHRVFSESQWAPAVRDAFRYDSELIVEEYVKGRELTVGIVGTEALPVIEIVAPGDWYGYDAKYTKGRTKYLAPAPISAKTAAKCRRLALKTFRALGCRGLARVDIRLAEDGAPYVLELNNIPGFTETSLLPKAAAESGLNFAALCDRILRTVRM